MGFTLSDAAKTRIIVSFACVQVVATAAVMFGWPAVLVVLKDEGQYDELCTDESSSSSSSLSEEEQRPKQRGLAKCNAQEVKLNLIFTVSYLFNALSCLSGPAFDIIGPRISNLVGAVVCCKSLFFFFCSAETHHLVHVSVAVVCAQFVITGMLLFTFSDSKGFDGFMVGGACLGLGLFPRFVTFDFRDSAASFLSAACCCWCL